MIDFQHDPRFTGIEPFEKRVWLSSPTMHGEEQKWVDEAFETNWVSTFGKNINEVERQIAERVGCKYAVGLNAGTAALHLATRLAAEKLYGQASVSEGTLRGNKVFATDVTFSASANPVAYENGEAVFIDTEYDTWNMSPEALEKAFALYPEVKIVIVAHLYGTPAKMEEIRAICDAHGAVIIEDAAEALGAKYLMNGQWVECGSLGDYCCLSFNGNKIITGSTGGMFLSDSKEDADTVRKWSTQSREDVLWYQHQNLGYNYRMSNIVAGVIRGQIPHIDEHIAQKRAIRKRYEEGLKDLPVKLNPWDKEKNVPNHWLSCMLIDEDAMAPMERGELDEKWETAPGKSSPSEILSALYSFNVEGRPIWKPMHMQPIYRTNPFVTIEGNGRGSGIDVGADIFARGICLPSDNKMTPEQQDRVIDIIHRCFM